MQRRRTIIFLFATLPLIMATELECQLPEPTGEERDDISICALCSDTDAAMKWNIREGSILDTFALVFKCRDENETIVLQTNDDSCFANSPRDYTAIDNLDSAIFNGTTVVNSTHLRPGIRCSFTVVFSFDFTYDVQRKTVHCTVKTPEQCRDDPELCIIDRIRRHRGDNTCGYQCGTGFFGSQCLNINECEGNHTCHEDADCHDTIGSYECQCQQGYQGDGHNNCTDIDECAGSSPCHDDAVCQNTDGSYLCQCLPGFQGDGINCANISQCQKNEMCTDENAECLIVNGRHTCECVPGFTGDSDNCTNIDECLDNNTCIENAVCRDTYGSFLCECSQGFEGNGYINCSNINECKVIEKCHENSTCHDSDGSYWCQCLPGFQGDGYNCTEIDECMGETECDRNAECLDYIDGYQCRCRPGFSGNGYNCSNINECDDSSLCSENSVCHDTHGSYLCQCPLGFQGDGYNKCTDINECDGDNNCHKDAKCHNAVGSYWCLCKSGFTGDGFNCTDIDECKGNLTCHEKAKCRNTFGSFECLCNSGYRGDGHEECTEVQGVDVEVVVIPIAIVTTLVVLSLFIALPIIFLCHFKKKKLSSFHELTKMDLDPHYEPKFWQGSLHSIRSMYERLMMTEQMTNIEVNDTKKANGKIISNSQSSTDVKRDSSLDLKEDGNQGEKEQCSEQSLQHKAQSQIVSGGRCEIPCVDSLNQRLVASTEVCTNKPFDVAGIISISMEQDKEEEEEEEEKDEEKEEEMERSGVLLALRGYIIQENMCRITESTLPHLKPETCELFSDDRETTVEEESLTYSSSGYHTESMSKVNTNSFSENNSKQTPKRSNRRSSGYSTGSDGSLGSTDHELSLPVWNSESSLESSDTTTMISEPEEIDIDTIKFTINTNQELAYINNLEQTSMAKIKFNVTPQN